MGTQERDGRAERRARALPRALGCVGCSAVALFGFVIALFLLDMVLDCLLFGADPSDIRFKPALYVGRTCRGLQIKTTAWADPSVTVTNRRDGPIRDLRVTAKYFGYDGRLVTGWEHESLASGESVTFQPPVDVTKLDLGMICVLVKCDQGVAVERSWFSYWY